MDNIDKKILSMLQKNARTPLKALAEKWAKAHASDSEPLPLGVFKQNGRYNPELAVLWI